MFHTLPAVVVTGQRVRAPALVAPNRTLGGVLAVLISLLSPAHAIAQNFEPAGADGATWVAVDLSVTFRRDDGLMQTTLLEVPRIRTGGVSYALAAARFDCEGGFRTIISRTWFSGRRDPFQTVYDQSRDSDSPAIGEQFRVVCGGAGRTGSVTLQGFVDAPR